MMSAGSKLMSLWASPTLMTWLNLGARVSSLLLVLPLILRQFTPGDISLYYLFSSIIGLQLMCGTGFVPTLARFVSFVLSGAKLEDLEANKVGGQNVPMAGRTLDPATLVALVSTMRNTFVGVVLVSTPLAALIGTIFLVKPVGLSSDVEASWIAWAVVLGTTPFVLLGGRYSALLQGSGRIALDQRWSALFVIFGALSGLAVITMGGGLLALVFANQIWQVAGFYRLRWLAHKTIRDLVGEWPAVQTDVRFFRALWPAAWRSIVGILASNGVTAAIGLVFAQFLEARPLAELLFGVRIMSLIAEFSRAPFYSRIPHFNSLRAENRIPELTLVAGKAMRLSYAAFIFLALAAPWVAEEVLTQIGSQIGFPSSSFWFWLAAAHLIERMGAMHVQLYSTTNHIIWHWLNGISGLLWIALLALLLPRVGLMAYPWAMIAAYSLSYSPVAAYYSVRSLKIGYLEFEQRTFFPALVGFSAGAVALGALLQR